MTFQRPNIVWLLVDSVRSYESSGDERGKLDIMRRFGAESVEFANVVTSAPSTVMSISAMMTSLPAYWIARNYDDFWFDRDYFVSLNSILQANGYSTFAFFRRRDPREKFRNVLDPVAREYWLPHLRHEQSWTNRELLGVIRNVLTSAPKQPVFMFVHFTCRNDPHVSEVVEECLAALPGAGFTRDNTIVVLCSDHGYPDPSRGFTPEGLRRQKLSHDLILTDDNVKIPLYLRYPGCSSRVVESTVSSLDITPTLLDLAGVNVPQELVKDWQGQSLRPLTDGRATTGQRRFVRSDARLLFQSGRITALRTDDYKYMRHHGRPLGEAEELYDLRVDPLEGENLARTSGIEATLEEFRTEFARQEAAALGFHIKYGLTRGLKNVLDHVSKNQGEAHKVLLAFVPETLGYYELVTRMVVETFPSGTGVDVVVPSSQARRERGVTEYEYASQPSGTLTFVNGAPASKYSLKVTFTVNPSDEPAQKLEKLIRGVRTRKSLTLDCNLNTFTRERFWHYRLRALKKRLPVILDEPLAAFGLLWKAGRVMKSRVKEGRSRIG